MIAISRLLGGLFDEGKRRLPLTLERGAFHAAARIDDEHRRQRRRSRFREGSKETQLSRPALVRNDEIVGVQAHHRPSVGARHRNAEKHHVGLGAKRFLPRDSARAPPPDEDRGRGENEDGQERTASRNPRAAARSSGPRRAHAHLAHLQRV